MTVCKYLFLFLFVGVAGTLSSCGSGDKEPPSNTGQTTGQSPGRVTESGSDGPQKAPSARSQATLVRDLLREAARAELEQGGLLIDFGTADQHKYTRGGWGSGWGPARAATAEVPSHAVMPGKEAWLGWYTSEPVSSLAMRARSPAGEQTVRFKAGNESLGEVVLGKDWQDVEIELKQPLPVASQRLTVVARDKGVAFDWLHARGPSTTVTPEVMPRVDSLKLGQRVRRALLGGPGRTYSFYLHVPADARLIADYGAERGSAAFSIDVDLLDGPGEQLFRADAEAGQWREAVVDLRAYAGRAVRLRLSTEGQDSGRAGWGEPGLYRPRPAGQKAGRKSGKKSGKKAGDRPRNLIVIVLDTTRADSFQPFSTRYSVDTPHMNAFAERSAVFTNAYNNENWTKPSVTTILSGLYPMTHTARWSNSKVPEDVVFLSQHLQKHGFTTEAMVSNAVVSEGFGFDRGWDSFDNRARGSTANSQYLYPDAAERLARLAEKDRFFLYLQSVDPHTPYDVPREYSKKYHPDEYKGVFGNDFTRDDQSKADRESIRVRASDLAWVWALYHGEVSYQDHYLGEFLAKVEELGLLDNTMVVITNDHGEELDDHGGYGHGWRLYEDQTWAPLMIHYPPLFPAGQRVPEVVEHVDLAPTIVDALGLPAMADTEGLSFLPLLSSTSRRQLPWYAVAASVNGMRSIRVGRWKLITGETKGWLRLFDLQADRAEESNLLDQAPLAARMCDIYLGEALAVPGKASRLAEGAGQRVVRARNVKLDGALQKTMEALGYLDMTTSANESSKPLDEPAKQGK